MGNSIIRNIACCFPVLNKQNICEYFPKLRQTATPIEEMSINLKGKYLCETRYKEVKEGDETYKYQIIVRIDLMPFDKQIDINSTTLFYKKNLYLYSNPTRYETLIRNFLGYHDLWNENPLRVANALYMNGFRESSEIICAMQGINVKNFLDSR